MHGTLLRRNLIVYLKPVGPVLLVQLHIEDILILIQLRLRSIPRRYQLLNIPLIQSINPMKVTASTSYTAKIAASRDITTGYL